MSSAMVAFAPSSSHTRKQHPTPLVANVYLAVGLALLVFTSLPTFSTLTQYIVGITVELVLAALALLAIRAEGLDVRTTARLRGPTLRESALALLSVPGLWAAGVALNLISSLVLGYTTPTVPSQFPSTALEAVVLGLTTVVVAPICEELMFRGYVQRAYERRHPLVGVLVGSVVFALFHLRFQGAPALIPVALALSAIAWRTQSIVPGILIHAAYNLIATVLMVALTFCSARLTGALTLGGACMAIALTPISLGALWYLWRGSKSVPSETATQPPSWNRWAAVVPALGLCLLYSYAAATEIVVGAFPQLLSKGDLQLSTPERWEESATWVYAIQNAWGEELGEATCTRGLDVGGITLVCDADYEGYDLTSMLPELSPDGSRVPDRIPGAHRFLSMDAGAWSLLARWETDTLAVQEITLQHDAQEEETHLRYSTGDADVTHSVAGRVTHVNLPDPRSTLFPHEWAWRLGALPMELAYAAEADLVLLDRSAREAPDPARINITGGEPVWTPAGTFIAWKVVVTWRDERGSNQEATAWYDAETPHTLVMYDDGSLTYVLDSPVEDSR